MAAFFIPKPPTAIAQGPQLAAQREMFRRQPRVVFLPLLSPDELVPG
jgi:hypothetical protein